MDFVNWCNNNIGFATLILSALTLFVSILAVIVSIHTAKLPYKKKVLVVAGSYLTADSIGIHIYFRKKNQQEAVLLLAV